MSHRSVFCEKLNQNWFATNSINKSF
ncbi:hypothetical protein CBM2606_A150100 [Cupriavidus taiwanensis]|nr:hypothetical protein CBM2606_A150100 [Cupriavidus taiwanensis]